MQIRWNFREDSQILMAFFKAPAEKPKQIFISLVGQISFVLLTSQPLYFYFRNLECCVAIYSEFENDKNELDLACVASVSVQFGSKELQGDEWSE